MVFFFQITIFNLKSLNFTTFFRWSKHSLSLSYCNNIFASLIEIFLFYSFLLICGIPGIGGNQRDLARAKNQKKLQDQKKGNRSDGLTVDQRKQRFVSSPLQKTNAIHTANTIQYIHLNNYSISIFQGCGFDTR